MVEVLMTCSGCGREIAVEMDRAVLRMDVTPRPEAELLFCCPRCDLPSVRHVGAELLTLLLFVGVEPVCLAEPTLPIADRPPTSVPLRHDDLLTWHEQLRDVDSVAPWVR
ncbi:hypothetical protein G5V58_04050 [Nocardioides anomalus]|uniref:CpXC domain-containing protein n=1 Tax=Nocardioides anomalus TaxID=2712223 RepID=A0A6G6WA80_9ACTN|nr:hypothetical protein [Nocardioides anomalus]QIG42053.1 hypothetical protein G5V58_04050 [Nocardioides anomalus]